MATGAVMNAVAEIQCTCGSIGADPSKVRFAECHHRYFRGDKELASVSKVIRETWPLKKNFEDADPWTLENARDRGVVTDWLFSEWLANRLTKIPAGTRTDAIQRFNALRHWWLSNASRFSSQPDAQVILADNEIAGTADLTVNVGGFPWVIDLKNVSAIDQSYYLQLGAYAELYEAQFGTFPDGAALIHVTQPRDKPVSVRFVEVDLPQARADWQALRAMWNVVRRRTK